MIQAEYMQRALEKGEPPLSTAGLYCPLPKGFKGEHRKRVARVLSGGSYAESPQAASPTGAPTPPNAQNASDAGPAIHLDIRDLKFNFFLTLKTKRKAMVIAALVCCAIIGTTLLFMHFHDRETTVLAQTSTPIHPQSIAPSSSALPPPSPPAAQQTPVPVENVVEEPQASTEQANATTDPVAKEEAASEAKKFEEQQKAQELQAQQALAAKKQRERQALIGQITSTLEAETARLGEFQSNCHFRINLDTNKISKLARSSRKLLAEQISSFDQKALYVVITNQTAILTKILHESEQLPTDPQADPEKLNHRLQTDIARMNVVRDKLTSKLDQIDVEISNAPKRGFLFSQ